MRYYIGLQELPEGKKTPYEKDSTWGVIEFNSPHVKGLKRSEHDSLRFIVQLPNGLLANEAFTTEFHEMFLDMIEHAKTQE